MNQRDFCFWLKGLLEFDPSGTLPSTRVSSIRENLKSALKFEMQPGRPNKEANFCMWLEGAFDGQQGQDLAAPLLLMIRTRLAEVVKNNSGPGHHDDDGGSGQRLGGAIPKC